MTTVKLGSSCPDVLYLQRFLGLSLDGSFGPLTEAAVKTWQESCGLSPDGVIGPKSWDKIIHETREKITEDSWTSLASTLGCEVAVLKAIKEVETGSKGPYDTSGRPTLLFEAHLFWRNLQALGINPVKFYKDHPGILSKVWNKSLYKGGSREWDRLQEAWEISPKAAIQSASYGFPQILGQNFRDPWTFVADCYMSEVKQLDFFGRFLGSNGFGPYLKSKNFEGIAKKYNGPGFKANQYDKKLEAAYRKYKG